MKVVITGGTGLIGSHLRQALLERDDEVVIVSRSPGGEHMIPWDPTQPGSLTLPEGTDAVVHLAGAPLFGARWSRDYKQTLRESRVQGTRTVNQAIQTFEGTVRTLVSASGIDYYGDRGDEELTEEAEPGDDFLAGVCTEWEQTAYRLRDKEPDTTVATLRTSVVLAPDGGALDQMLNPFLFVKPFHWGLGGPLGSGNQFFPWIHIEDEVGLILHILDHRLEGPFNMAAPGPIRNREFTRALGSVLNRPTLFPIPKLALRTLYGEVADILYTSQRAIPRAALKSGYEFHHPDVEVALRDILSRRG